MKAKVHNLKLYISTEISKFLICRLREEFIVLWLVCLYCSSTNYYSLLTWVFSCLTFQSLGLSIFIFRLKLPRQALKVHLRLCKTDIYIWHPSESISLINEDLFPFLLLCNLKYISLYFIHDSMKSFCKWSIPFRILPCFLQLISFVLGRLVKFNIAKTFLCRRPVFPDLSATYDYAGIKSKTNEGSPKIWYS